MIDITFAGDIELITNCAGLSDHKIMSIRSPLSSFETACTLDPRIPTHAPTGSKRLSLVLTAIFAREPGSRAADLISSLDDEKSKEILKGMNPRDSSEVQTLLQYSEDSAGGIMQTELVQVKDSSLVKDAINWIRLIADDVPDFYQIYVTNENDKLVGIISLKSLILAGPCLLYTSDAADE